MPPMPRARTPCGLPSVGEPGAACRVFQARTVARGNDPRTSQGRDTRMAQIAPHVGIDCCDERLDVHIHPLDIVFSVTNTPAGWPELDRRLRAVQAQVVAIEASGGCERDVCRFLLKREYSVRLVDPYRVRQFAKAAGRRPDHDRIDAAVIAL